jgi:phosphoserine phosphatase
MEELLFESVDKLGAKILIISDANSIFIHHILTARNLHHLVT